MFVREEANPPWERLKGAVRDVLPSSSCVFFPNPCSGGVKPSLNPGFSCSSSTFAVRTENKAGPSKKLGIPRRLVGSCNPHPPAGESSLKGFRAWVFVSASPLLGIGGFGDVKILIISPGEESGWASPLRRVERSPSQQIFISGVLLQHSLKVSQELFGS